MQTTQPMTSTTPTTSCTPDILWLHPHIAETPVGELRAMSDSHRVRDIVADAAAYTTLARHATWRNALCDAWHAEFTLDGYVWSGVEFHYQHAKYAFSDCARTRQFALAFARDCGSRAGSVVKCARALGGASQRCGHAAHVRDRRIVMWPHFYTRIAYTQDMTELRLSSDYVDTSVHALLRGKMSMAHRSIVRATCAKFMQNAELAQTLLATRDASLHLLDGRYRQRNYSSDRLLYLEHVRYLLRARGYVLLRAPVSRSCVIHARAGTHDIDNDAKHPAVEPDDGEYECEHDAEHNPYEQYFRDNTLYSSVMSVYGHARVRNIHNRMNCERCRVCHFADDCRSCARVCGLCESRCEQLECDAFCATCHTRNMLYYTCKCGALYDSREQLENGACAHCAA